MTFFQIGRYLLGLSFVTNLKSSLSMALTTQNTTENSSINLQAQNATALQLRVFLTGIYQLLDTNKGRSAFFYLCRVSYNPCFTNRYTAGYLQRLSTD